MLSLTRRIGERIIIGDPANPLVVVEVHSVNGDKVRLAFEAPRGLAIDREELAEAKRKGLTTGQVKSSKGYQ